MTRFLTALLLAAFVTGSAQAACPAGMESREWVFHYYLEEPPVWALHSTYTGDALAELWVNFPSPPPEIVIAAAEAVIFVSPQGVAVLGFFDANGCTAGAVGPMPADLLLGVLGIAES